jgi:hypothetical protein
MSTPSSTTALPLFVPRTVVAFERAATNIARRVVTPVRQVGVRSLEFANRVVGGWLGAVAPVAERPTLPVAAARAAENLLLPQPWYELHLAPVVEARPKAAAAATQPSATAEPPSTEPVSQAPESRAAERGAAIERTALDAPVGPSRPAPSTVMAPLRAETPAAPSVAALPQSAPLPEAPRPPSEVAPAITSEPAAAPSLPAPGQSAVEEPHTPPAPTAIDAQAAAREPTAAEALGLRTVEVPVAPPAPIAAAPRPLSTRVLDHARWADTQLRLHSTAPVELAERAAEQILVAPWTEAPRAPRPVAAPVAAPSITIEQPVVAATPPPLPRETQEAPVAAESARPPSVSLPDVRLAAALPPMLASGSQRVLEFLERLVGFQAAIDAEPLPFVGQVAPTVTGAGPVGVAVEYVSVPEPSSPPTVTPVRAPAPSGVAPSVAAPATAPVQPAPAPSAQLPPPEAPAARSLLRPGGLAARIEQLAVGLDVRAANAWGETPVEPAPSASQRVAPRVDYVGLTVGPKAGAAAGAPTLRATTGPAHVNDFIEGLVGAQAVRDTAPHSIAGQSTTWEVSYEPDPEVVRAPSEARTPRPRMSRPPAAAPSQEAPDDTATRMVLVAAAAPDAPSSTLPAMRLGGVGLRAEQLGGVVGVRAAGLAIDFVDPARLSMLAGARPELEQLWRPPTPPAPPREPATAAAPAAGAPAPTSAVRLSGEEWALVATFPSTATAVQMSGARRSAEFLKQASAARAPERDLLTTPPPSGAPAPTGGVPPQTLAAIAPRLRETAASFWPIIEARDVVRVIQSEPAATPRVTPPIMSTTAAPPAEPERPTLRIAEQMGTPSVFVGPTEPPTVAAADRAALPGGRTPRGGFIWPRSADFSTTDWSMPTSVAPGTEEAQPGTPLWGAMRPSMPQVELAPQSPPPEAESEQASRANALAFARPFLELVRGGLSAVDASSEGAQYVEHGRPTAVRAAPSSDAASKIVEAVRSTPATTPSDDRVSLADLTLISIASATQQFAAAPEGGGGHGGGGGGGHGGGGHGGHGVGKGGGKGGGANINELARHVFEELQRLMEIARERSGDPWES